MRLSEPTVTLPIPVVCAPAGFQDNAFFLSSLPVSGEKSSKDERVACAMLATQLDNFLGGDPVQHRQVQGYESPEFMALFPRGVSYKVRRGQT